MWFKLIVTEMTINENKSNLLTVTVTEKKSSNCNVIVTCKDNSVTAIAVVVDY